MDYQASAVLFSVDFHDLSLYTKKKTY
jgi:hypothetical protein